jgi:hypothetical protein
LGLVYMKAKKRTIRWKVNRKSIDVDYGRIRDGMASFSFAHYKNITSSTQGRILRIIKKFGNRWVYTIWKEGYNEIDLWYKEPSEKWLLGREPSKARLI